MKYVPCYYAPDADNAWSVAPGALSVCSNLAPLQNGNYATVKHNQVTAIAVSSTVAYAQVFTSYDGTQRFIVANPTSVAECGAQGTLTTWVSGITASDRWGGVAWGANIYITSNNLGLYVSQGATFTAVAGAPNARMIAANSNFVMVANCQDFSGNDTPDTVWWSAIRNPNSWTPQIATQAGKVRLLDSPGPITALISYKDGFVAFKNDATFIGTYVGAQQYVFAWRMVSSKLGCVAPRAVAEMDGKLYFMHWSGVYSFDGQNFENIGLPVFQSLFKNSTSGQINGIDGGGVAISGTPDINYTECATDDLDGNVFFALNSIAAFNKYVYIYAYNARSRKWGYVGARSSVTSSGHYGLTPLVRGSMSELRTFFGSAPDGRLAILPGGVLYRFNYPDACDAAPVVATGMIGGDDKSVTMVNIGWRAVYGSSSSAVASVSASGYSDETKNIQTATAQGAVNAELSQGDFVINSRYIQPTITGEIGKTLIIAGIGVGTGRR